MDDLFLEKVQMQVLDFATDKRTQWESKHQLYSVIFELTPKCNFNCVHCYLHDHHRSEELPYDEIIRIIDILYDKEVLFITFTGGDIFTRKDFLDIYLYAKRKGFIIELYTNGALITEKDIQVFLNIHRFLWTYHCTAPAKKHIRKSPEYLERLKRSSQILKVFWLPEYEYLSKHRYLICTITNCHRLSKLQKTLISRSEQVLRYFPQLIMIRAFRIMQFLSKIHCVMSSLNLIKGRAHLAKMKMQNMWIS